MNKLEIKNVSFLYSSGTPFEMVALDNINVSFEKGKITGLIGHTGSGKSTLVNLLNGLYKPTSGAVLLDGKDIWEKPKEIAKITRPTASSRATMGRSRLVSLPFALYCLITISVAAGAVAEAIAPRMIAVVRGSLSSPSTK